MPYRVFPGPDWRSLISLVATLAPAAGVSGHAASEPALAFVPEAGAFAPANAVHGHTATSPALAFTPAIGVPLLSINADGGFAVYDGTPPSNPVLTAFDVQSPGFDAAGNAMTRTWINRITARTRVPGTSTLSASGVALELAVASDAVISGVTNNSADPVPAPLVHNLLHDGRLLGGGGGLDCQYAVFHYYGDKGDAPRQVARVGVRLTNLDTPALTITKWTTDEVLLPSQPGDQHALFGYRVQFTESELDALGNGPIAQDVIVQPWIGTAFDSASYTGDIGKGCARKYHVRDTTRAAAIPFCRIDPVGGNDTNGVWATSGTPDAFQTIAGARASAKVSAIPAGAYLPAGALDGCEIRLLGGDCSMAPAAFTNAQRGAALRIVLDATADPATTRLTLAAATSSRLNGAGTGIPRQLTWIETPFFRAANVQFSTLTGTQHFFRFGGGHVVDMNASITGSAAGTGFRFEFAGAVLTNNSGATFANPGQFPGLIRGLSGTMLANSNLLATSTIAASRVVGLGGLVGHSNNATGSDWMIVSSSFPNRAAVLLTLDVAGVTYSNFGCVNVEYDYVTAANNPNVRVSSDSSTANIRNMIWAGVSSGGKSNRGRYNMLYSDTGASAERTLRWLRMWGAVGPQWNTKHDDFSANAANVGLWQMEYGVGCRGIVGVYRNADVGSRQFGQDYCPDLFEGTSDTTETLQALSAMFTNYTNEDNPGAGDYYPPVGSFLRSNTFPRFVSRDIAGAERSLTADWPGAWGANRP
jgi:hypothetical protein